MGFINGLFKTAVVAGGVVGGAYLVGQLKYSDPPNPPPDMTQPHTDPIQKDAARISAVQKLDNIRTRIDDLAQFAREMGAMPLYEQMKKDVAEAFRIVNTGNPGEGLADTPWVVQAGHAERIETPVTKFLTDVALDKDKFESLTTGPNAKYPDVLKLKADMEEVRKLYRQSQGVPSIDVQKNTKSYTDQALLKPMTLIMPVSATEDAPAFAMISAVAREMDRLGAPQDLGGSARTLGEIMRGPAPKDPRGSSELFHAMNIMERYLALDAEMRKNSRYTPAMANVEPKYKVSMSVTFNSTTTAIQNACVAVQNEIKKRHNTQVGVCKWSFTIGKP